jgi:hypothetical protein
MLLEKFPVPKEPVSLDVELEVVGVPPAPVTQQIPLSVAFAPPVLVIELVSKTALEEVILDGVVSVVTEGALTCPTKLGASSPYLPYTLHSGIGCQSVFGKRLRIKASSCNNNFIGLVGSVFR